MRSAERGSALHCPPQCGASQLTIDERRPAITNHTHALPVRRAGALEGCIEGLFEGAEVEALASSVFAGYAPCKCG
jgi:hypothetical protein